MQPKLDNQLNRTRAVMRWIMAAFFVAGFAAHLYAASSFEKVVPDWVPFPAATVFITGIIEWVGAIALLIPRLRWWAGVMLALYVIAVWPANFKHAFEHIEFTYLPDSWWYHAPRLALQPVIAWWALFCAGVVDWPLNIVALQSETERMAKDARLAKERNGAQWSEPK